MIADMMINFVAFGVYGILKPLQETFKRENCTAETYSLMKETAAIATAGAIAGISVTAIVTPAELIKILLQTNTDAIGSQASGRKGFVDCVKASYNYGSHGKYMPNITGVYGGIRVLSHGLSITAAVEVVYNALYFVTYELLKREVIKLRGHEKHMTALGMCERLTLDT